MTVNVAKGLAVTGEDESVLARTIFGEASGESLVGKIAVGFVIVNRARQALIYAATHGKPHPLFGDGSIKDACTIGHHGIHQFSCWNEGIDKARMLAAGAHTPGWQACVDAAHIALTDPVVNPIGDCTYYYNPNAVAQMPSWAVGQKVAAAIGHHLFFDHVN